VNTGGIIPAAVHREDVRYIETPARGRSEHGHGEFMAVDDGRPALPDCIGDSCKGSTDRHAQQRDRDDVDALLWKLPRQPTFALGWQ
jgi:hypothetical protein